MKKTLRRLSLSRETLQLLEAPDLGKLAAGTTGSESCCMTTIACFYDSDCRCTNAGC